MRSHVRALLGPALVTLGLLAVAEGGLRLAGWEARIAAGGDPYLNLIPLFRPAIGRDGVAVLHRRGPEDVTFLARKPANGFRLFVLGESSVEGFPYGAPWSFPAFLQRRLASALPGTTVEVVNAGVNGIASWDIRRIAEEIVRYQPDVVILYAGHNDFTASDQQQPGLLLRFRARLRLFQLATSTRTVLEKWRRGPIDVRRAEREADPFRAIRQHASGRNLLSADERRHIAERFEADARAIVELARRAGAVPLLVSLGQNLRDQEPGASRHRPGLAAADLARWTDRVAAGGRAARDGQLAAALAAYADAMGIDSRPAILHFRMGRVLERLGRSAAARTEYRRASDLDAVPLGAPSSLNARLERLAAETGTPFVDVARALAEVSPHGLVGSPLFVDHVHPTIAGHQRIAAALSDALGRLGLPRPAAEWSAGYRDPDPRAVLREHPDLVRNEHVARIVIDMSVGQTRAARHEAARAAARFPDLRRLVP